MKQPLAGLLNEAIPVHPFLLCSPSHQQRCLLLQRHKIKLVNAGIDRQPIRHGASHHTGEVSRTEGLH